MKAEAGASGTASASAAFGAVAALIVLVAVLHGPTALAMVRTWSDRDTYTHGFTVVPIVLGWIWLRRATLAALPVRPSGLALAALAALGFAWSVFDALAAQAPSQFAVVAMVPAAVAAVLGTAWVRALAFPLAYLFFAVPAGDALVPLLMNGTADFVVFGLQLVGVPVFREADRVTIPSGEWTVAEACSGVRYLIACAAVGTVYAAATYRSWRRRAAFVAAMIAAAVVANWVRALAIVLLAHGTNNRLAVGIDHLVYGWLLFGLIVGAMFWLGGRWREDAPPAGAPVAPAGGAPAAAWHRAGLALVPAALLVSAGPLLAQREVSAMSAADAAHGDAAVRAAAGWIAVDTPVSAWRPRLDEPAVERVQAFEKDGVRIGLHLAVYDGRARGAKVFASNNRLVPSNDARWTVVDRGPVPLAVPGGAVVLDAVAIAGDGRRLVAWPFFWVDGLVTGSRLETAWALTQARLRGRPAASAWVTLYAETPEHAPLDAAPLAAFWRDMRPAIEAALRGEP